MTPKTPSTNSKNVRYNSYKSNKKQVSPKVLKKENPFSILKNINFK